MQTGWIKDTDGKWYHLDSNGAMQIKWVQVQDKTDSKWYYMNDKGEMQTGWLKDDNKWYYFNENGKMATEKWVKYWDDNWYYLGSDGTMQKNKWIYNSSNGNWYHVNYDGVMETGWIKDKNGNYFYLYTDTGQMATGWMQDGDDYYYFDADNGKMKTGWVRQEDEMDYFGSDGRMQIHGIVEDGEWKFYNSIDEEISVDLGDSGRVEEDETLENILTSITPGGPVAMLGKTIVKDGAKALIKIEGKNLLKEMSKASSKVLRKNLIDAGIEVPNYANAAHHIVAGRSKMASEAQAILKKFGIDINDATNGVFLPTAKGASNSAYHPSLHTNAYYNKVNDMLRGATSKNDVLDILSDISEQLSKGTFMK